MDPFGEMIRSLTDLSSAEEEREEDEQDLWMDCTDYKVMIDALTTHEETCCCGVVCTAALVMAHNLPGCGMVENKLREGPVTCETVAEAAEISIGLMTCLGLPRKYVELKFCDLIRMICPEPPDGFGELI